MNVVVLPPSCEAHKVIHPGILAPLAIQPQHLLALLGCIVVFSGWLVTVSGALPVLAVVFFALLMGSVYYLGRVVLHLLCLDRRLIGSLPFILLTGSLSWALVMLAMHSLLPGSLRWHTTVLFILCAAGQWISHRGEAPLQENRASAWLSLFVVVFSLAAATCWARGLLHPQRLADGQVQFNHWQDHFDHTAFTTQLLARQHLWRFGNKELSNAPTPLYHYASYLFPAALASFSRLSSYNVTVALWTPLGTFLMGLAAYVLAATFAGRTAGVCAAVALLALPDASYYGLHNAWFRYHWLQQIAAAGMYGVAGSALALVFLLEAKRTRSSRALFAAGLAAAVTFFLKAQIFAVLIPFLVVWFILCYPRFAVAWRLLILAALVAVTVGGIAVSNRLHVGPHIGSDPVYFEEYCKGTATEIKWEALRSMVDQAAAASRLRFYITATTMIVLSTFGALVAVVPLLGLWAWWTRKLHAADLAPWLVMLVYVVFLVGLNDRVVGVNSAELIHRPFVWAYFIVLTWCAGKGWLLLRQTRPRRWTAWVLKPQVICAVSVILLVLPWHMGRNAQEGQLKWRSLASDLRFPEGLVECSRFIAHTGSRQDIVQDTQYDDHLVFGSLTERRSFLARPQIWKKSKDPAVPAEIEHRYALLERLKTLTAAAEIREVAARTGIRWYLVHPDDRLPWPAEILEHPAFRAGGFVVYDLTQLPHLPL
jgi:hypothetical protein